MVGLWAVKRYKTIEFLTYVIVAQRFIKFDKKIEIKVFSRIDDLLQCFYYITSWMISL